MSLGEVIKRAAKVERKKQKKRNKSKEKRKKPLETPVMEIVNVDELNSSLEMGSFDQEKADAEL